MLPPNIRTDTTAARVVSGCPVGEPWAACAESLRTRLGLKEVVT